MIFDLLKNVLIGGGVGLIIVLALSYLTAGRNTLSPEEPRRIREMLVSYKKWWDEDSRLSGVIDRLLEKEMLMMGDVDGPTSGSLEELQLQRNRLRIEIEREIAKANFLDIDATPLIAHLEEKHDRLEEEISGYANFDRGEKN